MSPKVKRIDSTKFYHAESRDILEDVNSIPELYYLANLAMSVNMRTKVSPELALIISYEAYSELINYFGGTSLYIPTREELQSNLLGVMSYYYYNVKGLSWNEVMKKLGVAPTKGGRRLLRNRWKVFKDIMDAAEHKVPDITAVVKTETPPQAIAPVHCQDTYVAKELFDKVAKTIFTDLLENGVISPELAETLTTRYE